MNDTISKVDKRSLVLELNKIYELRALLERATETAEEMDIINTLSKKIDDLDALINKINDSCLDTELNGVDFQIRQLQEKLREAAKEYDASCRKMQEILEEQDKDIYNDGVLLSDEEIHNMRQSYLEKKLEENRKSISIKNRMDQIKARLNALYESVATTSLDVVEEPFAVETDILSNVEVLAFLDNRCFKKEASSFIISSLMLDKVQKSLQKMPEKIINNGSRATYIPGAVPQDMSLVSSDSDYLRDDSLVFSIIDRVVDNSTATTKKEDYECKANNVHVSGNFLTELKSEKYDYDIVYSMHNVGCVTGDLLLRLSSGLADTDVMRKSAGELKKHIISDLSDEELKILFDWYKRKKEKIGNYKTIHNYIFDDFNNN